MCYDAQSATLAQLKYALHRGDAHWAEELQRKLFELNPTAFPYYHASGYSHPPLLVFTNAEPMRPQMFSWGLIPYWTKTAADAEKIRNQTLNAKGETIFEKPSFRTPARSRRCLVYLDAFYEHHHAGKLTYPFRISMRDGSPLAVAGLWDEWTDRDTGEIVRTVTIVTTTGNQLMSKIHNNPRAEMGPRMPVILPKDKQDAWLAECRTDADKAKLMELIRPLDDGILTAWPVGKLRGKEAVGNRAEVMNAVTYPALALMLTETAEI
jgi:putative SOS response-associated peptidase YedK